MRRFFSFRSSYSNGNDNISSSDQNKNRKKVIPRATEEINTKNSNQDEVRAGLKTRDDNALRPLNQNLEQQTSSSPSLRRSLSLTSNNHGSFTPDRYIRAETENMQLNGFEKPYSPSPLGVHQNSSNSKSVCSSPILLRCRTARSSQISSQNSVLELYIDGEQDVIKVKNDSQKCASHKGEDNSILENNKVHTIGRPPRATCSSTASSHYNADNQQSFSIRELTDNMGKSISGIGELNSRANALVENIYEDSSLGNPTLNHFDTAKGCSFDLVTLEKKFNGNLLSESFDIQRKVCYSERRHTNVSDHDELMKRHQEHESNEDLLNKLKELEERYYLLSQEDSELEKLHNGSLNEAALLQNSRMIKEFQRCLIVELSLQIKSRLAERSFVNERLKQSKLELNDRMRRSENEKNEVQLTLERELDRRSDEWSLKLSKFQTEEQRLRERVRELAQQNVSLQREVLSLQGSEQDAKITAVNIERQLNESRASNDELKAENIKLRQSLFELQERIASAEEQRNRAKSMSKEMERKIMELQKIVSTLQRTCSEQDKTISDLRQACSNEKGDGEAVEPRTEKIRLSGVEQKLRRELEACRAEAESLRDENSRLLNCLQGSENRYGHPLVRLNAELHAWTECLKKQGLSLLDDSSRFCAQLIDSMGRRCFENDADGNSVVDHAFRYQILARAIGSFRRSLNAVSTALEEKPSIHAPKFVCQNQATKTASSQQDDGNCKSVDDIEMELKAEALLSRLLREKICSKELEIEHLHGELASSVRNYDLILSDNQKLKDEISCLNHLNRDLKIQVMEHDENQLLLRQELQECTRDLTATRNSLASASAGRDLALEEARQLRERCLAMDCELKSLHKRIEFLDEDVLIKGGQISILKDTLGKKAL